MLNPVVTDRRLQVNAVTYLRYVQEAHGVPLMRVDLADRKVLLGIDGLMLTRSEPPPDDGNVDRALQHIEDYVNTVDWGRCCLDPRFAKTSIFEALLYFFVAPFAHEHMGARRRAWHDLLYRLRKASLTRDGDQLRVDFKDDMQHPEVRAYAGHLPQTVKHKLKGKTIVIESPREFEEWLGSRGGRPESRLRRLFARIKPGK